MHLPLKLKLFRNRERATFIFIKQALLHCPFVFHGSSGGKIQEGLFHSNNCPGNSLPKENRSSPPDILMSKKDYFSPLIFAISSLVSTGVQGCFPWLMSSWLLYMIFSICVQLWTISDIFREARYRWTIIICVDPLQILNITWNIIMQILGSIELQTWPELFRGLQRLGTASMDLRKAPQSVRRQLLVLPSYAFGVLRWASGGFSLCWMGQRGSRGPTLS